MKIGVEMVLLSIVSPQQKQIVLFHKLKSQQYYQHLTP